MKRLILTAAVTLAISFTLTAQTRYEKTYSNSKQLSVEGTLNDQGKRTGNWTWWYPNGQMSQQGSYVNGQKSGTWTLYYEDGSRMAEECHGTGVSRSWFRNGDLKSEVNVKELMIVPADKSEIRLVKKIKPQFKVLGKKVGAQMKAVAAEIAAMTQDQIAQIEAEGSYTLHNTPYTLIAEDVEIITEDMPGWLVANNGILTIALDIELTDELIEEGLARELINRIQNLRKSSGLEITDRITVELEDCDTIHNAVLHCGEYIASQVLATSLKLGADIQGETIEIDGQNVAIKIEKA